MRYSGRAGAAESFCLIVTTQKMGKSRRQNRYDVCGGISLFFEVTHESQSFND